MAAATVPAFAGETGTVSCTVAAKLVSIEVSPADPFSYGVLPLTSDPNTPSQKTTQDLVGVTPTVTNKGTSNVRLQTGAALDSGRLAYGV